MAELETWITGNQSKYKMWFFNFEAEIWNFTELQYSEMDETLNLFLLNTWQHSELSATAQIVISASVQHENTHSSISSCM